jgi:four helix bundle protein
MGDYKKLKVWQRSREFARQIYIVTQKFPDDERFGLISQMRRAAVSIMSNLAEGSGRDSDRELIRFARISMGSAMELESNLILAADLRFADPISLTALQSETGEIRRMLGRLILRLRDGGT